MKALRCLSVLAALCAAALLGGCLSIDVPDYDVPDVHLHGDRPEDEEISRRRPPPRSGAARGVAIGGYDSLAHVGKPVALAAWLQSARSGSPIPGATIGFYLNGTLLAQAQTDAAGVARAPWVPLAAGTYPIAAKVVAVPEEVDRQLLRGPPGRLVVSAQMPSAPLVVVDLDYCVFASRAKRVWLGSAKPMPGSISALVQIARTYPVVYLTRSPDELSPPTRHWLDRTGYPQGPVLLAGASAPTKDARQYKSARLSDLRRSFPALKAGVLRKDTDAETYAGRGITAFLLADEDEDDPDDLRKDAREIRRLAPGINVVAHWQEVAAGLLQGRRHSPEAFARRLERRADLIEARERKRDD